MFWASEFVFKKKTLKLRLLHRKASAHTCASAPVSLAEGERLKRQGRRGVCECVHANACGSLHTCPLWSACTHTRAQNCTGNRAENCCVTGICLTLPLSLVSSSSFPPHNPRLFLESSEMRERKRERESATTLYAVKECVGGWEREKRGDGGWNWGR